MQTNHPVSWTMEASRKSNKRLMEYTLHGVFLLANATLGQIHAPTRDD